MSPAILLFTCRTSVIRRATLIITFTEALSYVRDNYGVPDRRVISLQGHRRYSVLGAWARSYVTLRGSRHVSVERGDNMGGGEDEGEDIIYCFLCCVSGPRV